MSSPAPADPERGYENLWVFLPEVVLNDPNEPAQPEPASRGYEHCYIVLPEIDLDTGEVVPPVVADTPKDPPLDQEKKSA